MVVHNIDSPNELTNGTLVNGSSSFVEEPVKRKTISLSSSLIVETYSHTWKIRGFDEIPFISKYPILSPNFVLGKENGSLFQVVLTKHFFREKQGSEDSEDDSDSDSDISAAVSESQKPEQDQTDSSPAGGPEREKRLGLRLVKIDDDSTWDVLDYTFTLKTVDGFTVKTPPREEPGDCEYEAKPRFLYLTEKDFEDRNLFNEKNLDVVCGITYKYWKDHPVKIPTICVESQFAEDFKLLQSSRKFCDVLLKVDGTEIAAHKSVLCARASGFEDLLEEEKSATKQTFDLKMDAEVGKAFIHFLYCGDIPDGFPVEKCVGLFKAADTYGVVNLKQRCSEYFKNHLHSGICKGLGSSELDLESVAKLDSAKTRLIFSKKCTHTT